MVKVEVLTSIRFNEFYEAFTVLMNEGYGDFTDSVKNYFLTHDYSPSTYKFWLEKGFRRFSIAIDIDTNKIVGFLIGDTTYGGIGFISWIGVLPQYRNRKIGQMLLEDYEAYAKSKKAHLIELFTYEKVKPFYEKLGFKEIGRRDQGFYGNLNIIMDKKIGDWNDANLIKQEI